MRRTFAIGDIHGCNKTLRKLLFDTIRLTREDVVYCIGDYIDRGPDSKGVIDTLLELRVSGYEINTLRGNHEQLMMESVHDENTFDLWLRNGGLQTLNSFQVDTYNALPDSYRFFFEQTELYFSTDACIFVHAGIDLTAEYPFRDEEALLWSRETHVDDDILAGRLVVHGHTPLPADVIPRQKMASVINIDGGCVYPHRRGYGYLFALEVNSRDFVSVKNVDF